MCEINMTNEYENVLFKSKLLDRNSKHLGEERRKLFYFVCIPIRLLIFCTLLYLSQIQNETLQQVLRILLMLIYISSIFYLLTKKSKCQWWFNEYEIFLSTLAVLICIFVKKNTVFYVSIIMLLSILGGIAQSIILNPFVVVNNG